MNKQIRQLEDDLISVLNGSTIPIEAKRFVVLDVLHLIEKEADKTILAEIRSNMETIVENGELEDAEST